MISPMVYRRIAKRAKENNMRIPVNYREIINCYKNVVKPGEDKIVFSWLYDTNSCLNANAMVHKCIIFNAEWAARIVLFDNLDTMNAFRDTIGHELTHKDKEFSRCKRSRKDRIFVARINEVHADFGAGPKMMGNRRDLILQAIEYKKSLKKKDKESKLSSHPSWEKRYEYIKNYDFNRKLIERVAEDMGYTNAKLIDEIDAFYDDIVLIK